MRSRKITKDQLIREYRQLKKKVGKQPTCTQFAAQYHSIGLLSAVFGHPGWKKLVLAAGDKPRNGAKPLTRQQVVQDYLSLRQELGRPPKSVEYYKRYHSNAKLRKVFGSFGWNSLLKAAGQRPRHESLITRKDLIGDYLALKKKLGRRPLLRDYQDEGYGIGIITKKFGNPGWRNLILAAGDQPPFGLDLNAKHLMNDFLNLQEKLGRRPKLIEYTYQCHTPKVLDRVFGKPGWNRMIAVIGKKAQPKNILTADHLIQDYQSVKKMLGRDPSQVEFKKVHIHTTKVLVRVFGTPGWSNLKKAALRARRR